MISVSKLEEALYEKYESQCCCRPLALKADELIKQLRQMISKDGEMTVANGRLLFTDFTSTLHRIEKVLKEIDRK